MTVTDPWGLGLGTVSGTVSHPLFVVITALVEVVRGVDFVTVAVWGHRCEKQKKEGIPSHMLAALERCS